MSDSTITLIVILVLAAATVVFFIIRKCKEKSDLDLLSPEDQERHTDIVVADRAVKDTQRAYDASADPRTEWALIRVKEVWPRSS